MRVYACSPGNRIRFVFVYVCTCVHLHIYICMLQFKVSQVIFTYVYTRSHTLTFYVLFVSYICIQMHICIYIESYVI